MTMSFKGAHCPQAIILMGVRWYVAYPLSYRHVEELMEERGVRVDHATIQRWVVKYSPCWRPRSIAASSRCGSAGAWMKPISKDEHDRTIDFLLTEYRDKEAALRFLKKAVRWHVVPKTITIDGSDTNEAAIIGIEPMHMIKKRQLVSAWAKLNSYIPCAQLSMTMSRYENNFS
jgi:transposase-like protein